MWIYLVVTLLLATETVANNVNENLTNETVANNVTFENLTNETVANNVTFESLTSIANEITQLPALYCCKNGTRMCKWRPPPYNPHSIETELQENGYNCALLSTDGKYPALSFVYNTENGSIIYCSTDNRCSTKTENIYNVIRVQVEESGDRVVVENITLALRDESQKIVEQCSNDSSNVIDSVNTTLRDESEKIMEQCSNDSSNVIDSVNTTLRDESLKIMEQCSNDSSNVIDSVNTTLREESQKIMEQCSNDSSNVIDELAEQCKNDSFNVIQALGKTAEKCEDSYSTNGIILFVLIIHCLLALPLQARSIWGLIKHIFKCVFECLRPSSNNKVDETPEPSLFPSPDRTTTTPDPPQTS